MNDLPDGWAAATMGDIAAIIGGGTPSAKDPDNFCAGAGYPWLTPADLSGFQGVYVSRGSRNLTAQGLRHSSATLLPRGAVMMSSRAPIGYLAVAANEIATNQGFKSFICAGEFIPEYVYFWLKHITATLQEMGSGSTFAEISGEKARGIPVRFPPTPEQRRIVETVEALLAQVNAARARLAKVPLILKRFRQSVLAAACSGKLTADWRNDPEPRAATAGTVDGPFELPVEWTWRPFRDLLASIRSGSAAVPQPGITQFPILRSSSVRRGVVDLQDVRYLAADQSESDANYISEGDLLFTRLSGSLDFVGNCARVPALGGLRIQYPDRLFCGKLKEPREGEFFELVFRAPFIQKALSELAKSSAGHQRISMGAITDIFVPYPSPAEQDEIIRRVTGILAVAETIERRVVAASARADALAQSILANAFRGELVATEAELARAEGRDYESAAALLARIQAERAATVKPSKGQRGGALRAGAR